MEDSLYTQKCNRCSRVRSYAEFHADQSRENGIRTICKECRSEAASAPVIEITPPKTSDQDAVDQAVSMLIESHKAHYEHLLYSVRIKMGLEVAGHRFRVDRSKMELYGLQEYSPAR